MNNSFFSLARASRQFLRPSFTLSLGIQYATRLPSKRAFSTNKMAEVSSPLADKLKALSLSTPLPTYPNCFPDLNAVDIYRAHLTELLHGVTGVGKDIIYPALQWTQTLEKGDLVLPIPALRIKGKKPNELAAEWVEKVSVFLSCGY